MTLAVCVVVTAWSMSAAQTPAVNVDARILQEFDRRLNDYAKLHKKAESQIHKLKPTDSPDDIARYGRHLAHRIREERRGVTTGNIFTPPIAAEMRRLIAIALQGAEGARIRESLAHATPVPPKALRVDYPYPPGAPLQSTPPSLLANLPPLPADIDYRIVGRDLILRDVDANLVIDYVANAIP